MPDEILGVQEDGQGISVEKPPVVEGSSENFPGEKETVVESKTEQVEGKYHEILSRVTPQATTVGGQTDGDALLDAKSIGATVDEESKVQKLLDLASTKGVVHAVKVARSLKDYYALDRMHDELIDKLYEGLLAKGLISKD